MANGTISLWPVIVGGLLTMAGGLIAAVVTVFSKMLDWDVGRKRLRLEKFEQLLSAIYEHAHWAAQARQSRVYADGTPDPGMSPFVKIEALAYAYFHAVIDDVVKFKMVVMEHDVWMAQAMMKRIENKHNEINDGLDEMLSAYSYAQLLLINHVLLLGATNLESDEASKHMDAYRQRESERLAAQQASQPRPNRDSKSPDEPAPTKG